MIVCFKHWGNSGVINSLDLCQAESGLFGLVAGSQKKLKEERCSLQHVSAHETVHFLRSAGANKDQAADDGLTPLLISAQNNQRLCTQQSRYILLLSLVCMPNKRTKTPAQSAKHTSDWVLRRPVCSCIAWHLLECNILKILDQVRFQYLTHLYFNFNLLFLNSEHWFCNLQTLQHRLQRCLSSCHSTCLRIVRRIRGRLAMGMLPQSRRDSCRWGGASSAIWCKLELTLRWRSRGGYIDIIYIYIYLYYSISPQYLCVSSYCIEYVWPCLNIYWLLLLLLLLSAVLNQRLKHFQAALRQAVEAHKTTHFLATNAIISIPFKALSLIALEILVLCSGNKDIPGRCGPLGYQALDGMTPLTVATLNGSLEALGQPGRFAVFQHKLTSSGWIHQRMKCLDHWCCIVFVHSVKSNNNMFNMYQCHSMSCLYG